MDFLQVQKAGETNQITRAYLDNLLIESRYIDSTVPDISTEIFGKKFSSPIMIAAFSHLDRWHEKGMVEIAKGAKKADICNWAGMGDEAEFDEILATGASSIKIVKPYADRSMVYNRLEHAYKNGALAVGMDTDHSFNARGEADVVCGIPMAPVSLEELKSFVKATPLPFIVKGVLSVSDAKKCMEAGVSGIVVSHHHGIPSYGVPPLMILPKICEAVGEKMDIFVDCGIETGTDAFKALAMGAKAVCVGRAILPALKEKGEDGVAEYIKNMNNKLASHMARTGFATTKDIDSSVIWNT